MSRFTSFLRTISGLAAVLVGAGLLACVPAAPARALSINATYDSNWTSSAPTGATTDVTNVITALEAAFNNPVTVNVQFDWGDINGSSLPANALGVTTFPAISATYSLSQVSALFTTAAANNPTNAPLNTAVQNLPGSGSSYNNGTNFFIPTTEYKALTGSTGSALDAYVGFGTFGGNTGYSWDYSGGTPGGSSFDFTSVLQHEITHALGRVDYAFASRTAGGAPPFLTPLNLYTYSCGTTTLDPNFDNSCLSINGGTTDLSGGTAGVFDNTSDSADWKNTIDQNGLACGGTDSFDACLDPGVLATMSSVDFTEMCALGWSGSACLATQQAPVPEPPSLLLLLAGAITLLSVSHWRRRPGRDHPAPRTAVRDPGRTRGIRLLR